LAQSIVFELESALGVQGEPLDLRYAGGFEITIHDQAVVGDVSIRFERAVFRKENPLPARCTARVEKSVGLDIGEIFQMLFQNQLPPNLPKAEQWVREATESNARWDQPPATASDVPLDLLPVEIREFVLPVWAHLRDVSAKTVRALRWRDDLRGPPRPSVDRYFRWSLDGQQWHTLARQGFVTVSSSALTPIQPAVCSDVQRMVEEGEDEPLAHELLREAVSNRRGANHRSALVLAVAAIEVGLKRYIGTQIPAADWLLRETQSPPVRKLLSDFLPTVPANRKYQGKVFIPKSIRKRVHQAIERRNEIVHGGAAATELELQDFIDAIRDAIWLLDYYGGVEWALAKVSERTLDELRNEASSM